LCHCRPKLAQQLFQIMATARNRAHDCPWAGHSGSRERAVMDTHWQEELLALVTRYGEQCGQHATERATGVHGHPPANSGAAWAAIMAHLARAPAYVAAQESVDTA
jgi:hypothetical protein